VVSITILSSLLSFCTILKVVFLVLQNKGPKKSIEHSMKQYKKEQGGYVTAFCKVTSIMEGII